MASSENPPKPLSLAPSSERPSFEDSVPPPAGTEEGALWVIGGVIRTLRPHQWIKNVFVLAPVVFAKEIFDLNLMIRAAGAFGVFCVLAGAVYTMNDIADVEADRQHPVKRWRPIASGRVPVSLAKVLAVFMVALGMTGAAFGGWAFLSTVAAYFLLNVAYSFKLKHVAYLDVGIIAAGFVLRVLAGGFGTKIEVSAYLFACTALLALFLGFGKRRHELSVAMRGGNKHRAALESYTQRGLDLALGLTAVATVGTYVAYTLDPRTVEFFKTDKLWYTTVLGILGIWRFLSIVRHKTRAESPTQAMLSDGLFVAIVMTWVMIMMWFVYHLQPG